MASLQYLQIFNNLCCVYFNQTWTLLSRLNVCVYSGKQRRCRRLAVKQQHCSSSLPVDSSPEDSAFQASMIREKVPWNELEKIDWWADQVIIAHALNECVFSPAGQSVLILWFNFVLNWLFMRPEIHNKLETSLIKLVDAWPECKTLNIEVDLRNSYQWCETRRLLED